MPASEGSSHVDHDDFYQKLRTKIDAWASEKFGEKGKYAEWVLLAPDMFHLLTKLVLDPEVPAKHKAILGGAIAYFISPIDLMPEAFLGPVGYADDVGLAAFAIHGIINEVGPEVVRRHWAGKEDILDVVRGIVRKADDLLGSGLVGRLKHVLDDPDSIFRGLGRMRKARRDKDDKADDGPTVDVKVE